MAIAMHEAKDEATCPKCGKAISDCNCMTKDEVGESIAAMPSSVSAAQINEDNKKFWVQQAPQNNEGHEDQ